MATDGLIEMNSYHHTLSDLRIERFFRTLNQMLLCGLPGYAPAGAPTGKTLLTLSAFEAHLPHCILEQYHPLCRPNAV